MKNQHTQGRLVRTAPSLHGIRHIEMYVANHKQAAFFYRSVLGLAIIGQSEPSRLADRTSTLLARGKIKLIVTAPVVSSSPVAEHIHQHGEGIKDIAFTVNGVPDLFYTAVEHGATPLLQPSTEETVNGPFHIARIGTCGDLVHSLIDAPDVPESLLPGFTAGTSNVPSCDSAVTDIDHVALALDGGDLDRWVDFYVCALGFEQTHQEAVNTEYSGMNSKVVQTPDRSVRFPMMAPAAGRQKSQIENYINFHHGAGAQHLALLSTDIVKSASLMMQAGVEFLSTPATYYDTLKERVGDMVVNFESIRKLGILVDRECDGHLLQVFTKPIGSRPTLFLELIERRGAQGFGSGNIRALFESVERTQDAGRAG